MCSSTAGHQGESTGAGDMRTLFLLIGLIVVHQFLVQIYPPYRERVRNFDHKITLITIILVVYLVGNFLYIVFFR
jgi:hypothetical protein